MFSFFYRESYSQMGVKLSSNEALGILDSGYLEDYDGSDGQLTLYHEATATRYSLLMTELPSATPTIAHDVFQGYFALAGKPDGRYQFQGRLRDVAGNYTVLNEIANPSGHERVIKVGIEIVLKYLPFVIPQFEVTYRQPAITEVTHRQRMVSSVTVSQRRS
jgi:hypothetical protein